MKEKIIVPTIHTKFVNGKIVDYIPLNILKEPKRNYQLAEIIPEIILGPNFDKKYQSSLENFLHIELGSSFDTHYLDPTLIDKPTNEISTPSDKLQIYVSRGNPKSISEYKLQE